MGQPLLPPDLQRKSLVHPNPLRLSRHRECVRAGAKTDDGQSRSKRLFDLFAIARREIAPTHEEDNRVRSSHRNHAVRGRIFLGHIDRWAIDRELLRKTLRDHRHGDFAAVLVVSAEETDSQTRLKSVGILDRPLEARWMTALDIIAREDPNTVSNDGNIRVPTCVRATQETITVLERADCEWRADCDTRCIFVAQDTIDGECQRDPRRRLGEDREPACRIASSSHRAHKGKR